MSELDQLRSSLPDAARDLKLNLQAVLRPEHLPAPQTWGIALASAFFLKDPELADALLADSRADGVTDALIDDARAAATIMGMNTIYYRFRHLLDQPAYAQIPARLRMTRMSQLKTDKTTFELMSLACAALAGCGLCIQSHEQSLRKLDLSQTQINDAVRIASVLHGVSIGLSMAGS